MILELEHYKGDTILYGNTVPKHILLSQLHQIEMSYDSVSDNFTELLCRRFSYAILDKYEIPDYTYDIDTGMLY